MNRFSCWTLAAALAACCCIACSDDESASNTTGGSGGEGGGVTPGGAPSWSWEGCEPGTAPQADGSCTPAGDGAGIASCAAGFMPDGADGCTAILPTSPCTAGEMAVPGETACREISPCGTGLWGNISVENNTVYVDQNDGGSVHDGGANTPFLKVQDAISVAPSGAIVAIAAGSYAEDVYDNFGQPVRIWGRCPSMVAVNSFTVGGVGSEIRGVSTPGPGWGIYVTNGDVLIDSVWVHDNADTGVLLLAPAKVTMVNTLVEGATGIGVSSRGVELVVERSVVRGTLAEGGKDGRGINTEAFMSTAPSLVLTESVLEDNLEAGIFAIDADLTVTGSVIRDTDDNTTSVGVGIGILAQTGTLQLDDSELSGNLGLSVVIAGGEATIEGTTIRDTVLNQIGNGEGVYAHSGANLTMAHSVIDGAHFVGVSAIGADMSLDGVIVRNVASDHQSLHGRGINAEHDTQRGRRSSLSVTNSIIEATREQGVFAGGIDLVFERSVVRDTRAQEADNFFGRGINMQAKDGEPVDATIRFSVVERSTEMGMFVDGGTLLLEATAVRDTTSSIVDGSGGWGVGLQNSDPALPTSGRVVSCAISNSREVGIGAFGSTLDIDTVLVSGTQQDGVGLVGDGIAYVTLTTPATGTVSNSRVEDSARAGLGAFGATVELSANALVCNPIDLNGADEGGAVFEVNDLGGNACACDNVAHVCKLETAVLQPPTPRP